MALSYFLDLQDMWQNIAAWKLYGLWFIPNTLTTANCMHVALLVLIRLIDLEMPVKNEKMHTKLRLAGVISIWTVSAIVCAIPVISAPSSSDAFALTSAPLIGSIVVLHGCHTLPIFLVVILYIRVVCTISKTRIRGFSFYKSPKEVPEAAKSAKLKLRAKKNEMSRLVAINVIRLIVCYVPYIIMWHINMLGCRKTCEQSAAVRTDEINLVIFYLNDNISLQ